MYCCSILLCPNLIQGFTKIERLQRRATKYVLNDFSTDYKSRLTQLKLISLMYTVLGVTRYNSNALCNNITLMGNELI